MRLREQGQEDDAPSGGRVMERDLSGEDRLARTRRSDDEVHATAEEASAEDRVEPRHAGLDAGDPRLRVARGATHAVKF
jgi:hypothetical protein